MKSAIMSTHRIVGLVAADAVLVVGAAPAQAGPAVPRSPGTHTCRAIDLGLASTAGFT